MATDQIDGGINSDVSESVWLECCHKFKILNWKFPQNCIQKY